MFQTCRRCRRRQRKTLETTQRKRNQSDVEALADKTHCKQDMNNEHQVQASGAKLSEENHRGVRLYDRLCFKLSQD